MRLQLIPRCWCSVSLGAGELVSPNENSQSRWARSLVTLTLTVLTLGSASSAAVVSASPQVRVVQDMHTAQMEQIRADLRFERLLTTAFDKTLRIWRLADLRLLRTVHLPAELGPEGTPYSLALSADGLRAYVGGYTGWHWSRASHVYLIDTEQGRIVGKLGRFDGDVITALDLSPDGRRLAVGLGRGGLVVVDATTGVRLHSDAAYGGTVRFVHHAPDGRLASAADDGCLRVYAADGRLSYRNQYPPRPADQPQCDGGELGGVRFSPDGRWLALGTRYRKDGERWLPEVPLFDGRTLALRRVLRAPDSDQRSLCCIAWSPDAGTLYVNGSVEGDQPTPLYRVRDPERGTPERWNVGRQQFSNMLPMPDGSVVFATTAPSMARVGADGRLLERGNGQPMMALPDNVDFHRTRQEPASFVASADGRSVAFEAQPGKWLRADPFQSDPSRVLGAEGARDPDLNAVRRTGVVRVQTATGLFSHREPTLVNGRAVALGAGEGVRSWAVHATAPLAALGTQWRLHLVDAQARPMPGWDEPPFLSAPAFHTLITEDGRWVVVAVGDGTVRWFEVATGQERLGLFVHADGSDWVAWRPDGYYASSPQGDRYLGWLVNRGDAMSPDFYRAEQFERTLYRPDLLQAAFFGELTRSGGAAAGPQRLGAPRVRIEQVHARQREVRFTVDAPEAGSPPVTEIGVYVDGIPLLGAEARRVPPDAGRISRTVRVPDGLSMDAIRVEAEAGDVLGLDEAGSPQAVPASEGRRGRLWVLAVGVERFADFAGCGHTKVCGVRLPDLPNAPNDARLLADRLRTATRQVFTEARVAVLADGQGGGAPTKAALLDALAGLREAGPEDTTVVFMASHGIAGGPGNAEYYFLPADAQVRGVERVLNHAAERPAPGLDGVDSLLSATELASALRRVPGRRMLVIDTCHAGAADGRSNPHSLAKRSASAQVAVLAASNGTERSYEAADPRVRHGAFTHALLRGLQGLADADRDTVVTLEELHRFVGPEVADNTARLNAAERKRNARHSDFSQTPTLLASPVLRRSRLASRAGEGS